MHIRFPSIEQFSQVFGSEVRRPERRTLEYRAKIKLHGSNMGIRVEPDASVFFQSKKEDLSAEQDLFNFHRTMSSDVTAWSGLARDEIVTVYGEWAGPGINKGDAVQQTDCKRFYIFAVGIGTAAHHQNERLTAPRIVVTCPDEIEAMMPAGLDRDLVRVLPYEDDAPIVMDFSNEEGVATAVAALNDRVDAVGEIDPYIAREFGIRHPGEGYVLSPHATEEMQFTGEEYARSIFKSKTEAHRVRKQAKPATIRERLPETAEAFVEMFCTRNRIAQAVDEVCGGQADIRKTGQVIAWMLEDIRKEAGPEIEDLARQGVSFDRLKPEIVTATREGFMEMARAPTSDLSM